MNKVSINNQPVMTFGRYRGRTVKDVPSVYLVWAMGNAKMSKALAEAVGIEYCSREIGHPATHEEAMDFYKERLKQQIAVIRQKLGPRAQAATEPKGLEAQKGTQVQ